MCLQGAYCTNSLKMIQSKLIKMLHLLILQYKQAERKGNKGMTVLRDYFVDTLYISFFLLQGFGGEGALRCK